jgi:integrase
VFSIFWKRFATEAKVVDLHSHDLRHTFTTRLQNLGVPLEVRAALLPSATRRGTGSARRRIHDGRIFARRIRLESAAP